jgi:hypothetical protein
MHHAGKDCFLPLVSVVLILTGGVVGGVGQVTSTNGNSANMSSHIVAGGEISMTSTNKGNNTYDISIGNRIFPITYQITGSGNNLKNITAAKDNTSLLVNVGGSKADGNLTIQLPRNLIDSKKQGNQDSPYVIFEDSQPSQRIQEIKSNAQARTLVIDFDKGTNIIEIAGSRYSASTSILPANTHLKESTSQITTGGEIVTSNVVHRPTNSTAAPNITKSSGGQTPNPAPSSNTTTSTSIHAKSTWSICSSIIGSSY